MQTSRIFNAVLAVLVFSIYLWSLSGCAASGRTSSITSASQDSVTFEQLPVDPWALGPDVFAIATQSQIVVADAVQNDIEIAEAQPKLSVVIEPLESSRVFNVPVATSNTELPVSLPTSEILASNIAVSDTFFTVQLGTFLDRAKAQEFYNRASPVLGISGSIQGDWPFFRLRFGEFSTRTSADSLHRVAMSCGFYDARVLKITPKQ